ncbi:ribosomal RNA small subunit methyltransferase A [Candidatus Nomurabacteria bacterium CG_4_9_14_0_2_um_filter_32_10]|uniref:Ribosomal RNA small subunit methyltransferase A n=1 Tax=Candidatus Nomurabacteria bacterium CG_4_9_14_0_2_um_filter_32_10 TaxID=1974729 RepID=A0A2J0N6U2_9BACT|nr:MAG: ribosomal RNA small subunit methyltransferase A [Candidatus Nomurabacteria bacterium CG_4_9_14_0_2_um_filter_32_10]
MYTKKFRWVKAKKSLGQNFLKSEPALRKIIETGEISSRDIVLEIGPGKGALTSKLLATNCQVIAVEKDRELFEFLKIKFEKEILSGQLKLVCEDILDFNLESYKLKANNYKLIANIPYNITGAIFKKFLGGANQPEMMILMVQNEVAKRIVARDRKESILSISVKVYGDPKIIMKVPSRYFSPAPKVDSAIIAIKNISRKIFIENSQIVQSRTLHNLQFEEKFWEIIRAGFAHKRKKLSSNLKDFLKNKKDGGIASVKSLGNKRAEELTLNDWIQLTKNTTPPNLPSSREEKIR